MVRYSIGIDIGGTNICIGLVDENGEIINHSTLDTDLSIAPQQMILKIMDEIKELKNISNIGDSVIVGIGIGAPGPLDNKQGVIVSPPNLKSWSGMPIKQMMEDLYSFPIVLENDANAATLAEKWIGAGEKCNDFIYMTISTGIGAGIVSDGRLLRGAKGNAGDIGHTVINPSFGLCTCGQYGCLESIASGTAIARRGSIIMGRDLSTKDIFDLYLNNDPNIKELIENVYQVLGIACVNLINTFDTDRIIIGGGVSQVGSSLFNAVQDYVQSYALNPEKRKTQILPAQLKQNAGMIGAAALCFDSIVSL